MDFKEYAKQAASTALYPGKGTVQGLSYCALGITGEAGEFANKVKKIIRDDYQMDRVTEALASELGDVLWYLSEAAENIGVTLEEIARLNIAKLADRRTRSVVQGSGDNR